MEMRDSLTLYAAPLSLYSGKARAYLRWTGIPFEEVLSTPQVYQEVIVPHVGLPIIPVIRDADGAIVQDTTEIIDHLEPRSPAPSVYPDTPRQRLAALLLELYGDEWLVIPAMHYRWAYNEDWVYGEFGAVAAPDAPEDRRKAIGQGLGARFKGFLPALGITPETVPAIEASYEALLGELEAHFARYPYLLGARPSIGDFGLIGPLYAHLYRDPASGALMKRRAPAVAAWVERMHQPPAPGSGDFLPDDAIPETLLQVLRRQMREQLPVLADTAARFADWAAAHPDADIPRSIGFHDFTLENVTGSRAILPYSLWMLQRVLDYIHGLDGQARADANALLDSVGGATLPGISVTPRLARHHHRLMRA